MDTTGTIPIYNVLSQHKMITCLHKFHTADDFNSLDLNNFDKDYYALSTGISDNDWKNFNENMTVLDPNFVCIDVANGYSVKFIDYVRKVREKFPETTLIGGNVVTRELVEELIINGGLDIIKIGIGNGSVCTTRIQTGVGYPQLSAVIECSDAAHGVGGHIISDGGVKCSGDVAKAFGAGADLVMSGSLFAGHDESSGDLIEENGKKYKRFYGMSSSNAMTKYYGGVAKYRSAEGKEVKIPYKGPVENTVLSILGGIRSTMTYIGAKRLKDLPRCTTFLRVNRQVNTLFSDKEFLI